MKEKRGLGVKKGSNLLRRYKMKPNKRFWIMAGLVLFLVAALTFSGVDVRRAGDTEGGVATIGSWERGFVITVGTVEAAGTADYTCDGVNDDVEFQAALDALPIGGGKLCVLAGNYSFSATVTRAIDNVMIEGIGEGTYFTYDNASAIFSAGIQNDWVFRDFRTDNGGMNVVLASNWTMQNITVGVTYYAYRTDADLVVTVPSVPAQGVILYYNGTDWAALNVGVSGQHLMTQGAGADPQWSTVLPAGAQGDILYYNGANWVVLNAGTSGQMFATSGAGANPSWVDLGNMIVAANDATTAEKNAALLSGGAVCDGVNDDVEIQAAIDALPASGGLVVLSSGTFNVEVALVLDSYQTLRGCGRNTILTTTTADIDIITATGGSGTEKVGILIADLCVDGTAGASTVSLAINFTYVDYSKVQNIWALNCTSWGGVGLTNCDLNEIIGNTLNDNYDGVYTESSSGNNISHNTCQGNTAEGMYVYLSNENTISGNTCQGGGNTGIALDGSDNNTVMGNTIQGNGLIGISIDGSDNNTVIGNTLTENSQTTTNTADNIEVGGSSSYNNIQGNTCRAGALTNKPRYGIRIASGTNVGNLVENNDLYDDGFGTAPFVDSGTDTKLSVYVVPFSDGTDPQDSGFEIDANTEMARAWVRLPDEVQQVVRIKIYARSVVGETHKMELEMVVLGGADNEAFNTHSGSIAQLDSTSVNFAADDIIFWINTEAGTLALVGGDSVEIKVLHEAAEGDNCETDAYFRTVEIEYV